MEQKKEIKDFSLLDNFICRRLDSYTEPQRRGVPKGEKIGFSPKKYMAALLSMKNLKQKHIAEIARSTHNSVRKWNTEDEFLDLTEAFRVEYVDHVIGHLKSRSVRQLKLRDEYFTLSALEMADTPPPQLSMKEFRDLGQYYYIIVPRIFNKLLKIITSLQQKGVLNTGPREDLAFYYQCMDFLALISQYPFEKINKKAEASQIKSVDITKSYQQKVSLELLRRDLAGKGSPTEETLKATIFSLHYGAGSFREVDMEI